MYNFSKLAERKKTTSYKWDNTKSLLPMNIADMDFMCAPEIIDSLRKRVEIGAYGYSIIPDELFEAYKDYEYRNHNIKYDTKDMIFSLGVVPSISTIVRALTNPRERIIILTPNYNIFFNSIYNNGRLIVECPLDYKDSKYSINFKLLEEELKNTESSMMIISNPHNPVGLIYSKEDLEKIVELCNKYEIILVSDEIHKDIVRKGFKYNPIFSIKNTEDNVIALISMTKVCNMAGVSSSIVIAKNRRLKNRVERALNTDEVAEPHFFSIAPTIAALTKCDNWIKEMNEYVDENFRIYKEYIETNIKDIKLIDSKATYLAWIDVSKITLDSKGLCDHILEKTGLLINPGEEYGKTGEGFIRINLATSHENVKLSLKLLKEGIESFNK